MDDINLNPAQSNSFQIVLSNDAGDTVTYFARGVTIPGMNMQGADANYRNMPIPQPSNSQDRESLELEFILSEDYSNYKFFKKWAALARFGKGDISEATKDITVIILSSNKTPVASFKYETCAPTSISSIILEHGAIDAQPVTFNVSLLYSLEVFE